MRGTNSNKKEGISTSDISFTGGRDDAIMPQEFPIIILKKPQELIGL